MQRTRLNTLVMQTTRQFRQWVFNPWRRLSVIVISLLFGNFFATAISATAGQTAKLDVTISAILVIVVEVISWMYYRFAPRRQTRLGEAVSGEGSLIPPDLAANSSPNIGSNIRRNNINPNVAPNLALDDFDWGPVRSRSTLAESLNAFKLGMIYGLFVEAFKLGS